MAMHDMEFWDENVCTLLSVAICMHDLKILLGKVEKTIG